MGVEAEATHQTNSHLCVWAPVSVSIHEWHCLKSSFWKALTGISCLWERKGNNKFQRQVETKQLLINRSAERAPAQRKGENGLAQDSSF